MNRALGDASYNGRSLLGSQDVNQNNTSTATNTDVVRNEVGGTLRITGVDAATLTFDTRVATRGRMVGGNFTPPTEYEWGTPGNTVMTAAAARAMLGNGDQTATGPLNNMHNGYADDADFGGGAAPSLHKSFATVETNVNSALAKFGADARAVDAAIQTNRTKLDSLETGLGSMVDADLAKESARLQALQIRQQLGTQSLSIANQAPQALLSLFR
ncbi:MAG: hypothetical protein K2X11_15075 [Acetobacteraceae bacterium]|nr:hypothetical protein [Acetobacteraceae bacterium]